jgi:uncharacterized membrane protein YtjA (UPF0391 family)
MVFLVIAIVIAFFGLAGFFGADSRPADIRGRRWI